MRVMLAALALHGAEHLVALACGTVDALFVGHRSPPVISASIAVASSSSSMGYLDMARSIFTARAARIAA
jgi:hypothetical protein